ncbi:hypothetical protein PoB_004330300 [Plakobranchus ocellatus]|uniref:Galectin n=1 Tax=Plakobranchus ocellatus TaxID=259542 RepID=A0AAV4BD41_9GAST|nr:hypothetical protein PoB_004330300 [Plakobranchus ocellatus]
MAYFERNNFVSFQCSTLLLLLLCHVIFRPPICSYSLQTSQYNRVKVNTILCASDLLPLPPSACNPLKCARACLHQQNCTSFIFTPRTTSSPCTCSWCPAYSIRGKHVTSMDSLMEIWSPSSSRFVPPPAGVNLPIPGALSEGKALIVGGRIPAQPPSHIVFGVKYYNGDIALQPQVIFNNSGVTETMSYGYRIGAQWHSKWFSDHFPFAADRDFEFFVLATAEGFIFYIDGIFKTTLDSTENMKGEIGYLSFFDPVGCFKYAIF